jgi:hypothetical protein
MSRAGCVAWAVPAVLVVLLTWARGTHDQPSACGERSGAVQSAEPGPVENWLDASGIVKEPGVTVYMYGTHVLTDRQDRVLAALRSDTFALDNCVGQHVRLYGSFDSFVGPDGGPLYVTVAEVRPQEGATDPNWIETAGTIQPGRLPSIWHTCTAQGTHVLMRQREDAVALSSESLDPDDWAGQSVHVYGIYATDYAGCYGPAHIQVMEIR